MRCSPALFVCLVACSSSDPDATPESTDSADDAAATDAAATSSDDAPGSQSSGASTSDATTSAGTTEPEPSSSSADDESSGEIPTGPAPQWFIDAAEGEWIAIAGGDDETIGAVLPDPIPHVDGFGDSPNGIVTAWTGGGVDQERGEFLLVANGGHADYPGNEAYAISLREEAPAWRRLNDPTPNDQLDVGPATDIGALNFDGRPRSMHSTFECFGDGRMWFVYQNSYTGGAGDSTSACFSFDRGHDGIPDHGEPPLPWSADDLGPWTFYPNPNANWTNGFGRAAWDPVGHKVWAVGGNNNVNAPEYWSVDTAGPELGNTTLYGKGGSLDNFNAWVAIAYDLRILVAGGSFNAQIWVLSLDDAGSDDDWKAVTNSTGDGFFDTGAGGAYVIANHTLAIANPVSTGNAIHRLAIPTTAGGEYDPSGTWTWTTLTPGGATLAVADGNSFTYSKWNIVEDMGNGQSAIVVATDVYGPTYVYKVPLAGL